MLDRLHRLGFRIFLDLKYHDIPNTVAGACRSAAAHDVWMLNVHACGGRRMMEAARDAVGEGDRPLVIAVTVPTSLDESDLAETGVTSEMPDQVRRLARLAHESGLDGIVCSAVDLGHLRAELDAAFIRVTPGIRIAETADDQRRVTTPADAIRSGADYLVVGRPVTRSRDPIAALDAIARDIEDPADPSPAGYSDRTSTRERR